MTFNILQLCQGRLNSSDIEEEITLMDFNFIAAGFQFGSYTAALPQVKGGGQYISSKLSYGRSPIDFHFDTTTDNIVYDVDGMTIDAITTRLAKTFDTLMEIRNYWLDENAPFPVYLKRQVSGASNPEFATLLNWSIPQLSDIFGQTMTDPIDNPTLNSITLELEHRHWSDTVPGAGDCAKTNSFQNWQFTDFWTINDTQPVGDVSALLQAVNGYLFAGEDGQIWRSVDLGENWILNTTLPTDSVTDLIQAANGRIYAAVGNTGGAGTNAAILRTTDNGDTAWTTDISFGTAISVSAMVELNNGDILALVGSSSIGQIFRATSADDWGSWSEVVSATPILRSGQNGDIIQVANDDIFVAQNFSIVRSKDLGVTWQLNLVVNLIPTLLELTNGNILLFGAFQVWSTNNSGDLWAQIASHADNSITGSVQSTDDTIYIAGNSAVQSSVDDGESWTTEDALTMAGNGIHSIIQITNDNFFVGDNGRIWEGKSQTIVIGTEAPTCNKVFISNKNTTKNLNFIKIDDGGAFTNIYPIGIAPSTSFPQDLFPTIPAFNDALYIGSDVVFDNLVYNLLNGMGYEANPNIRTVYEYWNGASWFALFVNDNTAPLGTTITGVGELRFLITGINSVHWVKPSDWSTTTVDGDLAYWIRARIDSLLVLSPPSQQTQDIYTIVDNFINISELEILGDIPALAQIKILNQSDLDGRVLNSPLLYTNRIIAGLRSASKGENFKAFLNCSDEQNAKNVIVSVGTNTTFVTDTEAPTTRQATYNPLGVETMATRVTFNLLTVIAQDYYGRFHAYIRVQRTSGAITDFDIQIQVESGSGGVTSTSDSVQVQTTEPFELLDMGEVVIPVGGLLKITEMNDVLQLNIQASSASGTPNLIIYDLILIPSDENIVDISDKANTDSSIIGKNDNDIPKFLNIDSITNSKIDIRGLVQKITDSTTTSIYETVAVGPLIFQDGEEQKLWILTAQTNTTGDNPVWIAPPELSHSVQAFKKQQYLGIKGNQ